jgi:hypothetical protein
MVYSPKLTFVANGNNLTNVGLALGETIYFGSLEFTTNRLGCLSLSPVGEDSSTIFVGMVHNGSPSLHTTPEENFDEGDATLGKGGGSSGLPSPQRCNVVTPIVPITTAPPPENTPALLTILMVPLRTATLQLGIGLLPEQ